jgi:hypothetical protein
MVRTSSLKVVLRTGIGLSDEAYDMSNDARETVNIIEKIRASIEFVAAKTMLTGHFSMYQTPDRDGFSGKIPKHNGGEPWNGIQFQ